MTTLEDISLTRDELRLSEENQKFIREMRADKANGLKDLLWQWDLSFDKRVLYIAEKMDENAADGYDHAKAKILRFIVSDCSDLDAGQADEAAHRAEKYFFDET